MKKDKKTGFTLYHLLVIVVILALLAAVVWPVCSDRLDARRAANAPASRASYVESVTSRPPSP